MIDVMNKLKASFKQALRRLVTRWARPRHDPEATPPPVDAGNRPRHPLFGALKGLLRVMPGTDLTKPADPTWGKE